MGGINLHSVVSGAIQSVNAFETVTLKRNQGSTVSATGAQKPVYSATTKKADIQPLSGKDLRQIDSLNLGGTLVKAYFWGEVDGIVRAVAKGGDLVIRPDGSVWKTTFVFEQWQGWCSVCLALQDGQ